MRDRKEKRERRKAEKFFKTKKKKRNRKENGELETQIEWKDKQKSFGQNRKEIASEESGKKTEARRKTEKFLKTEKKKIKTEKLLKMQKRKRTVALTKPFFNKKPFCLTTLL